MASAESSSWSIKGKVVLITGGNAGIGKATVMELVRRGAKRVIVACRNIAKANETLTEVQQALSLSESEVSKRLVVYQLDLSSLQSVRDFAAKFLDGEKELNVLINNAGVLGHDNREVTVDGFELHFGTNHLGHFLLTRLLLDLLKSCAPSRIVVVASIAYMISWPWGIDYDDVNIERGRYNSFVAYGKSKLANILFARQLHENLAAAGASGVSVYSLHPGVIKSGLYQNRSWLYQTLMAPVEWLFFLNNEQGAATTLYCACEPGIECYSGGFFRNSGHVVPRSALATDLDSAKKLWEISERYTADDAKSKAQPSK